MAAAGPTAQLGDACMDLKISDKTGVVTGASSGIGRAIAITLAGEGVRLAIAARREERLKEVAEEIRTNGGADPTEALAGLGNVDILVNNAGGSRAFDLDTGDGAWDEALTLNFTRHRQLTHRLLPQMMERQWGRIINITGKSEPEGINGAFCAKAAMHSWAKGLSREVGRYKITVNSVPPGRIISEQILRNYSPEYRQWQSEHEIDVGEYGQPEDIANLVCFLASPQARYITGAVIPVDGGLRRYQF
jgi:3-oxoacyl-[acyl-carrier protein] reductase